MKVALRSLSVALVLARSTSFAHRHDLRYDHDSRCSPWFRPRHLNAPRVHHPWRPEFVVNWKAHREVPLFFSHDMGRGVPSFSSPWPQQVVQQVETRLANQGENSNEASPSETVSSSSHEVDVGPSNLAPVIAPTEVPQNVVEPTTIMVIVPPLKIPSGSASSWDDTSAHSPSVHNPTYKATVEPSASMKHHESVATKKSLAYLATAVSAIAMAMAG